MNKLRRMPPLALIIARDKLVCCQYLKPTFSRAVQEVLISPSGGGAAV
ncbi:MAG: hypothetical protein RMX57_10450 [Planktomarina sp.]|nr:hypothetical protein [Planktomarina sp.]